MAYDAQASAGLAPQDFSALFAPQVADPGLAWRVAVPGVGGLVGQYAGFTVLAVTQTQMTDRAGNLIDAIDISFQLSAHPGVFTYSAPADFYSWSSPLAGVAALAQKIEALYAIGSDSSPVVVSPPSDLPLPTPSPAASPPPPPPPSGTRPGITAVPV